MAKCLQGNGRITTCTVKAYLLGQMADVTKASTSMTRSKDLESTLGKMGVSTPASGKTDSSMAKGYIKMLTGWRGQVYGKRASESHGLMMKTSRNRWKKLIDRKRKHISLKTKDR